MLRTSGRWLAIVGLSALACGEDTPKAADPRQKERLEHFISRLRSVRVTDPADPERTLTFVDAPRFRFENPVSGNGDGLVFVWTDHGRPVVVMKTYCNQPRKAWTRLSVSLSETPLVVEDHGRRPWTPERALTFAPLPDAGAPARQPALRLVQMRKLAQQFTVVDHWGPRDPSDWQLRLLTTPLHRYDSPDLKVADAAVFGYVVTSSPEALLLLEARQVEDGLAWYYALSRLTRFRVTISRAGETLADFPRLDRWPPTGICLHESLPVPSRLHRPIRSSE